MKEAATKVTKMVFKKIGLEVTKSKNWPFGINWLRDIKYFKNGREVMIAFDIGANVGMTSLRISESFPESTIFSFEPVPSTYRQLVRNTRGRSNIRPIQCALGDGEGKGSITNRPLSGQNTLLVDSKRDDQRVDVDVDTINGFCSRNSIGHIGLIKVDTEGYDLRVLKGAETLLGVHGIDFIVLECDFLTRKNEPHEDFIRAFEYLHKYDFNVVSFYTGGVDDLGWVWGDVLLRNVSGSAPGRVSCSPRI